MAIVGARTIDAVDTFGKTALFEIKIKRARELSFRIWLAVKLIRLASRIVGTETELTIRTQKGK